MSADSTEAAVVEWYVSIGDSVKRGDPVVCVETEKANVELEADEDGVLLRTLASAGDAVQIGGPIAIFRLAGEGDVDLTAFLVELGVDHSAAPAANGSAPVGAEAETTALTDPAAAEQAAPSVGESDPARLFASPIARRMAKDADLGLDEISGTGPGGRIRRRDVEEALSRRNHAAGMPLPTGIPSATTHPAAEVTHLARSTYAPGRYTDVPHSRFRLAVANALTASKQQAPHFYLKATCRADALLALRASIGTSSGVKITVNDLVVKAAGRAMIDEPDFNVSWTPESVRRFESVDISVAVASKRGLLTPVVRSVPQRSLTEVSAAIKDLGTRAGEGRLKQHELEGGSLTISNLGMFGVEEFAAIIKPPQVGILAVGTVVTRPAEGANGGVELGRFMTVVLSVDHRPVDGVVAAKWLSRFKELIENPVLIVV